MFFRFILKIIKISETSEREREKEKVHFGGYIQPCVRVDQVGTHDGTIADRYLPILMTSPRCWHNGVRSDASGRPRWPTGLLVGEPVPPPSIPPPPHPTECVQRGWGKVRVGPLSLFLAHFIVVGNRGLAQLPLKVELEGELQVALHTHTHRLCVKLAIRNLHTQNNKCT